MAGSSQEALNTLLLTAGRSRWLEVLNNAIWRKSLEFLQKQGDGTSLILQKIKLDHEGTQVTHAAFIKT